MTRIMCSCADMQTHAQLMAAFDTRVNACLASAITRSLFSNDFGVDSSSRLPVRAWTDTNTDKLTDATKSTTKPCHNDQLSARVTRNADLIHTSR